MSIPAGKVFTEEDLASADDRVLVAVDGKVFDVTDFLESHPGGSGTLLAHKGTDATDVFHSLHSPNTLADVGDSMIVGELAAGDKDGKRMSLIVDGQQGGSASHKTTRCTPTEIAALVNIEHIAQEAQLRGAPSFINGYVNYGSEDEESIRNNRGAFARYALRPRVLNDVGTIDLSTKILGGRVQLKTPICIAPFAGAANAHPDGELALARAAAKAKSLYCPAFYSAHTMGEIRAAANGDDDENPLLVQLYPPRKPVHPKSGRGDAGLDRKYMETAIRHVAKLGFVGAIITVDTVNNSNREKSYKNPAWIKQITEECGGFPPTRAFQEADVGRMLGHTARITWDDVKWMTSTCHALGLSLVVKGVMVAEDAAIAAQIGVDAVIVSNHGGRQLDGTEGALECVAECAEAVVGTKCEIFFDSGVRRGKDVFKALALGASAVFVGRPALWGLTVGGAAGVSRMLTLFNEELTTVMQLAGTPSIADITPAHVRDTRALPWKREAAQWRDRISDLALAFIIGALVASTAIRFSLSVKK